MCKHYLLQTYVYELFSVACVFNNITALLILIPIIISVFRAAEIVFSLALAKSRQNGALNNFPETDFMDKLIRARRNLGLFQHHDGITGTAKDFVVVDYGNR